MNLIAEISAIFTKILFTCALGEDLSDRDIDYYENGKKTI
jgi:hypothetical protein